jgi:hypothetical protein
MYPGYLVALALSMGRVDDINFTLLEIANVVFYFGVTYLLLTALAKFRSKPQSPTSVGRVDQPLK